MVASPLQRSTAIEALHLMLISPTGKSKSARMVMELGTNAVKLAGYTCAPLHVCQQT